MVFAKRLREGVRRGEITCSVRIWTRPHVKVGARYRMEEGAIEVDSIKPIGFPGYHQSWLANRVSLVSSICSRLRSTVRVKISIWCGSTTCLHALSGQVNAS